MSVSENYLAYARLADEMIKKATKGQLAEVAQRLALNIGYYHEKYGDIYVGPRGELRERAVGGSKS